MKHLHLYLLCCCFVFAIVGCNERSTTPTSGAADPEYDRQMKETARQLEITAKQQQEIQRHLERYAKQAERFEKLLQRWEQQADRQDKLLDRQEHQTKPTGNAR